jgi:hypothetical protein
MKKTSILTSAVLTAVLTAGLQAYAATTWSDGSVLSPVVLGTPGHGAPDIFGSPYYGQISFSSLVTGGGSAYSGQALSGGTLAVEIQDGGSNPIEAWVSGLWAPLTVTGVATGTDGAAWVDFSLTTSELSYIQTAPSGKIDFTAEADCYLDAYYLTVTGTTSTVPDSGSTMMLLGGVLTTLGLIKRKMA